MTYVIPEVEEKNRLKLLNDMSLIADKIIIGDYLVPPEKGIMNKINIIVEFLAGRNHYRNF